ncbi:hypothetical protein KIPB_014267, partial [Kipferlia bialata]
VLSRYLSAIATKRGIEYSDPLNPALALSHTAPALPDFNSQGLCLPPDVSGLPTYPTGAPATSGPVPTPMGMGLPPQPAPTHAPTPAPAQDTPNDMDPYGTMGQGQQAPAPAPGAFMPPPSGMYQAPPPFGGDDGQGFP